MKLNFFGKEWNKEKDVGQLKILPYRSHCLPNSKKSSNAPQRSYLKQRHYAYYILQVFLYKTCKEIRIIFEEQDKDTMPLHFFMFPVHFSWVNIVGLTGSVISLLQNVYLTRSDLYSSALDFDNCRKTKDLVRYTF